MPGSIYPREKGKRKPKVHGGPEDENGTDVWVSQKFWEEQLSISWSVLPTFTGAAITALEIGT